MENLNYAKIPREIIKDNLLSPAIFMAAMIDMNRQYYSNGVMILDLELIYEYYFSGDHKTNKSSLIGVLNKGLEVLCEENYIDIIKSYGTTKKFCLIKPAEKLINSESFIMVDGDIIHKITESFSCNITALNSVKVYCYILTNTYYFSERFEYQRLNDKVCTLTQKYIADQIGLSRSTLNKIIDGFVELGILYKYKVNIQYKSNNDRPYKLNNFYCLPEDKDICDEFTAEFMKKYKAEYI